MRQEVERFAGAVTHCTGDRLVALFGAPLAQEDHVVRALQAALGLQRAVATFAEELRHTRALELRPGVGVHTGSVVLGPMRSDARPDIAAQGFPVFLAERLQALATEGAIYVSEAVWQQARSFFRFQERGRYPLPEMAQPVHVYACTGVTPGVSRLMASLQRHWSPLLGRERDLELLGSLWARACQGQGQVVVLFGEAGVGKSRLADAFQRTLPAGHTLAAHTLSYGQAMPYHALRPVLRTVLGLSDHDTPQQQRQALRAWLTDVQHALAADAPLLAARIDRLPDEAKALLQTAAVIGTDVPLALLRAIADVPEVTLHRGLAHLQAAEFLYETRLFPKPEYTFKHALTHEVAYGSLLQERRHLLHARIVEALEQRHADRLAEVASGAKDLPAGRQGTDQVEPLALHAFRGAVWDKAVTYGRQAGARANGRAAFRQAAIYFEQALAALGHLPDTPDTRGLAIEIRHDLVGRALSQMGEYGKGLALLREAKTLARALDDQVRLAQVLPMLAYMLRQRAEFAGALAAGQQALTLATARGDFPLRAAASHFLGMTYWAIGDYERAADLFRWNVEARDPGTGRPAPLLNQSRAWLAYTLSQLGQFIESRHHGEEALGRATPEGHGAEPIVTHLCLGRLYLAQGDLEAAIRVLDRGLVLCRTADNWDAGRAIAAGLGYACALAGRHAEGRALLEEALGKSRRMGALHSQSLYVAQLSAVCLLAGSVDEARQHARQALTLARQYGERGFEALALCQLGAVHAHADPPDVSQAEAYYQQALALAEELGLRPLMAHCHHGLGRRYHQTGRGEEARAALTAAIDLYRAMDMTLWLPQAEATLAQVEGR